MTSEYEYPGLAPICPKVFQQKWTHSILLEKDFRTEWHARAAAVRLSFECDTISENHSSWKPRAIRSNLPYRQVHFDEGFSLICSNHETATCSIFQGSHGEVQKFIQQFQSKPLLEADPLSKSLAVLISHSGETVSDEHNLMQFHANKQARPISCNEPDIPVWYPMTDRGDFPIDAPDMEQGTENSPSDRSNDDFNDGDDPQEPDSPDDPAHPPSEDHDRQSALMYHLDDPPIHAMLFWTDFDRLMSEIALHYQIPREELFDSYELNTRPLDIPPGTAPLLIHFANDFPHGSNLVLALVDIEVHGNECETHYQTFPDMQRKVIPVPAQLTRDTLLRLAKVFDYCKVEHERCLVEINSVHWPVQNRWPISAQHGDYIRIVVPPPTDCRVGTQEMLNDSHHLSIEDFWGQYYVPSSPESASGSEHSSVSPSLIASEDIKREFGPHSDSDHDEHSQIQQPIDAQSLMQMPGERSSSSSSPAPNLAEQNAQIINDSCLLAFNIDEQETGPVPKWFRGIAIAFGAHAAIENDNEGPVCYFDTWYADCRTASVTEVSRSLRLDRMMNLWQHDLRHLWRDKIQDGATIHVVWVLPVPPPAPLQRSAGHIIVYQFPEAGYVPFITTIHFNALEEHGTTFACVVEDPTVTPIALLQRLNLERVCRGRSCTLHRDAIGQTWSMPLQAGEGLRLFIPTHGARAHIDSLSYPKSVALVQTGPAPDAFDISMRLEDHPEHIRDLHEIWTRSARRGPAGMELILEITTWYLDAEFVPFNDQSRTIVLGEDFFEWEQQIREKWADLADASAAISLALVRPTPPGWSIDKVHLLVHQQFETTPSQIGGLVSIYDNALTQGTPSTHATVLPKALNRQHILEASNRNLQHEHHCSTWLEGFEIRDSSVFEAVHGQCFSVHIYRPQLQEWDLPLPAEDEAVLLQVYTDSVQKHAMTSQPKDHIKRTAIRLIPAISFDAFDDALPSFIELHENFDSHAIEQELQTFGLQITAFVIDDKTAALCCPAPLLAQDTLGRVVSINLSENAQQRYQVHYFQKGSSCDEIQIMRILHAAGYEKAVILKQYWHLCDVAEIHFTIPEGHMDTSGETLKEQRSWPTKQPVLPPAPMFHAQHEEITRCSLDLGVSQAEVQHFFTGVQWPLCTITDDIGLPECSSQACQTLQDLEHVDRLIIYTDGSSHSGRLHRSTAFIDAVEIPDSWAFLVLGERYGPDNTNSICLIGWMSHQVRYDPSSSAYLGARSVNPLIAEREALTWAFLWRIFLNSNLPTTFRTDSATTKGQAEGTIGSAECDLSFQMLRGCYHLLESALPPEALQIVHVYGHLNEPWNEFVDHVAKREAHASYYLNWPDIDLTQWKEVIPHLWMIFAKKFGVPQFCGDSFAVPPPALPQQVGASGCQFPPETLQIDLALSIATANVQSLGRAVDGFAGKTAYLRKQFASLKINLLGIQEARSEEGASLVDDIFRLCSGSCKSNFGVELWCNLSVPVGWKEDKPLFITRSDVNVAHKDPRRLLTHFQCEVMPFWVLVLHAPHSGQALAIREAWWQETCEILQQIMHSDEPLFVCADANAAPGSCDHKHVFAKGLETSSSTPFLREFLDRFDLCLPATSDKHIGDRETWTTPDGHSSHMIDFVCVPIHLFDQVAFSGLLDNFDLGTQNVDHTATALEIRWQKCIEVAARSKKAKPSVAFDRSKIAQAQLHQQLQQHEVQSWQCSVDVHFADLQEHFLNCLAKSCPRDKILRKKPYLTEQLWQCRKNKLQVRSQLKEAKKLLTRETLVRTFIAWKTFQGPRERVDLCPSFSFGSSLRCCIVKLTVKLIKTSKQLSKGLQQSKSAQVKLRLEQLPPEATASQIQHAMKPFIGPSSKLRQGMPPLPAIRDAQGDLCHRRHDTVNRWVEHFAAIEGGERISHEELRSEWVQHLAELATHECRLSIQEIPSRAELEFSLRQMKDGKASGPDGIPSELCRYFPGPVALQLYSLMLKSAIQGQEPIILKGGTALPIWKGKKTKDQCNAYRSILLSSNLGKVVHKTMRSKQSQVYEAFLAHQQIGGRKKVPVVLGSHLAKAFLRVHQAQLHATAVLFVDLEAAFYQVVRPLALAGHWDDEILASMAQRLRMPADTIQALYEQLKQPSAIESAGLPHFAQKAIRAFHSDTFFQVPSQEDCVKTHLGTRPGDAYADIVFGFLMARILHQFCDRLQGQDVISQFPHQIAPSWFNLDRPEEISAEHTTEFIGPTWMDDLALCLWGSTNDALARKLGHATSTLLDLMREHAMSPNLSKGKTELMFTPKGPGTHAWKKKLYGPHTSGFYPILGEAETYQVPVVSSYIHLGSIVHHSGSTKQEAKRRVAIANACFNKNRKLVFQNGMLSLQKRVEIFNSLVMSKLCYAMETWTLEDWKTREYVHAAIMRLYKRLLKTSHAAHMSDDQVLCQLAVPSPSEVLRRTRLRYISTLLQVDDSACWGLLNQDSKWNLLVQDDLIWMWRNLCNASDLGSPDIHMARWVEIMRFHRSYWKRLVRRAFRHAILQRRKELKCQQFYLGMREILQQGQIWPATDPNHRPVQRPDDIDLFGCMLCQRSFRTLGGQGAHMFRKHAVVHPVRFLFSSTHCAACLREYFTHGKMKMHLIRSAQCRAYLLAHGGRHQPAAGLGSIEDGARLIHHDNRLPPLQASGPMLPRPPERDLNKVHWELYDCIVETAITLDCQTHFKPTIKKVIVTFAVSWTQCQMTLQELLDTVATETEPWGQIPLAHVTVCLRELMRPEEWPFLQSLHSQDPAGQPDRGDIEIQCSDIASQPLRQIQRCLGRHRVILHAFSGRRRPGDIQFFLEAMHNSSDGTVLHVVSLDLMTDKVWGDASRAETQQFWRKAADEGKVQGFLAGPPCETWSQARHVSNGHDRGPRPVRSALQLWGLEALSLSELEQVLMGNDLLQFSFDMLLRLYFSDGFGVLEHPDEPQDEQKPSIWKLPVLDIFRALANFHEIRFGQGLLGAPSPKPTRLLVLNLPELRSTLRSHHLSKDPPKRSSIGRQQDGTWKTAYLKEYPPAMSRALAVEFNRWFLGQATDCSLPGDHAFVTRCRQMNAQVFTGQIGRDFASK